MAFCLTAILCAIVFSSTVLQIPSDSLPVLTWTSRKSPCLPTNIQASYLGTESEKHIEEDELYSDLLQPENSKLYVVRVREKSLLIFHLLIDTNNTEIEVEIQGTVNRTRTNVIWLPRPYIYYIGNESEIRILLASHGNITIHYRFYVDISEPLGEICSKVLPLEGGQAAFHVDLRKDDGVLISSDSDALPNPRIRVFVLYNEIVPEGTFLSLYQYGQSSHKSTSFTADLGGRYYIMVDSGEDIGAFSLIASVVSPPWNQEWFWLMILFAYCTAAILPANIGRLKNAGRTTASALIVYYFWLVTAGLALSVIGSFSYGSSIHWVLFDLLMVFYGMSHGLQIYASLLDRKEIVKKCPFCDRQVNLRKDNYCCGHPVKRISFEWFLMPPSLSFFFFFSAYSLFEWALPAFLDCSILIAGCGSILGGIFSWWTNRIFHGVNSWRLLVVGILFSLVSPLLISLLVDVFYAQHTELVLTPSFASIRTRVASLTFPPSMTLLFFVLSIGLVFLIAKRSREILRQTSIAYLQLRKTVCLFTFRIVEALSTFSNLFVSLPLTHRSIDLLRSQLLNVSSVGVFWEK